MRIPQCPKLADGSWKVGLPNDQIEVPMLSCLLAQERIDTPTAIDPEHDPRRIEPLDDLHHDRLGEPLHPDNDTRGRFRHAASISRPFQTDHYRRFRSGGQNVDTTRISDVESTSTGLAPSVSFR